MKLYHALIAGAAIMIAEPAYAQNYDGQSAQQREVTAKVITSMLRPTRGVW
jgi:hypothetical protein